MFGSKNWAGRAAAVTAVIAATTLASSGLAAADTLRDSIETENHDAPVALVAGSAVSGSASIRVVGNRALGDPDPGCNIDTGESPLVLDLVTPAGVTASPDPLVITSCETEFPVSFTAGTAAVNGNVTVTVVSGPAGNGTYLNNVVIPIRVTQPPPPPVNTKPAVSVVGVSNGATYEIGSVPAPTCSVTDKEDGGSTKPAVLTGALSHGLGAQTATCAHTDNGGLAADTSSATYTIVDTGNPTISSSVNPSAANANGWYSSDVTVGFTCADSGSGIESCVGDTTLSGEGADQSATGTATDRAGNTATATVSGIDIDKTEPTVAFIGGPGATYYFGSDPAAPTCSASDALSGIDSCVITGGGTTVGAHSYTATATDRAGNVQTATLNYTVLPWTLKGFSAPVDMGGVWNTVKGGSTVPLKFEVFAGATELSSTSITTITGLKAAKVSCATGTATEDTIEILSTGGTSLRYDSTGGQYIQNWKTPTGAGSCYSATMTTADGSSTTALFKIK